MDPLTAPPALPDSEDPRLCPIWSSPRLWNGITLTPDAKRAFACFPSADGPGLQVAEVSPDGTLSPFPDESWNAVVDVPGSGEGFVHVNAIRFGPDGRLWVVDAGSAGFGKPILPGKPRLFAFDLESSEADLTIDLAPALHPLSYVDDIRFDGDYIYATDAGAPGLIVIDRRDGSMWRALDGHESTVCGPEMKADGKVLKTPDGKNLRVHADQLEVSPDGRWLYYSPCSGPLYRVPTSALKDRAMADADRSTHVELFYPAGTLGGTAIDAQGALYVSQTNDRTILRITPDGKAEVLIADPRLIWADALWIDAQQRLWIPQTQQNLSAGFNGGQQQIAYPVWIFTMDIGADPAPNDHC